MDMGIADDLTLNYRESGFDIVRKWLDWRIMVLTFVALVLDVYLVSWFLRGRVASGPVDMMMVLTVLGGVVACVGLTYFAIAGWFNTTQVRVEQGKLTVRHGPVPWPGNKDLDAANIKQIYATEYVVSGAITPITSKYEVYALTTSGKRKRLLTGLDSSDLAFSIEQEIERYFHIKDAPVDGEIG